jgi:hypothetical protein
MTWARKDPVRSAQWEETLRRVEADEFGDLTPELREAAGKFLALRKRHHTMVAVRSKMTELQRLVTAPAGSFSAEHRLSQINRLFNELIDDLLDVPEPHRRRLFGYLMPLRERIKLMERELG